MCCIIQASNCHVERNRSTYRGFWDLRDDNIKLLQFFSIPWEPTSSLCLKDPQEMRLSASPSYRTQRWNLRLVRVKSTWLLPLYNDIIGLFIVNFIPSLFRLSNLSASIDFPTSILVNITFHFINIAKKNFAFIFKSSSYHFQVAICGMVMSKMREVRKEHNVVVQSTTSNVWRQKLGKSFFNSVMVDVKLKLLIACEKIRWNRESEKHGKHENFLQFSCIGSEMRNDLQMSEFFYF